MNSLLKADVRSTKFSNGLSKRACFHAQNVCLRKYADNALRRKPSQPCLHAPLPPWLWITKSINQPALTRKKSNERGLEALLSERSLRKSARVKNSHVSRKAFLERWRCTKLAQAKELTQIFDKKIKDKGALLSGVKRATRGALLWRHKRKQWRVENLG